MKRKFAIAQHANLVAVEGLEFALDEVTDITKFVPSPFLSDGLNRKSLDYLRWSWNPATGDIVIGDVYRHVNHIPKSNTYPFAAWVRGFYFRKENLIAIRPWHWPHDSYDDFVRRDSNAITEVIGAILSSTIEGAKVEYNVDNNWLTQTFSRYSTSW